jgi:hypothetical protein
MFGGGTRMDGSSAVMEASFKFIISRSSLVVNEASNGPRLPMIEMCLIVERLRTSRTEWGTSKVERSAGEDSRILAMSSETFPCPTRAMWSNLSRGGGGEREGCFVYQCTIDKAGMQNSEGGMLGWSLGKVQPVAKRR